MGKNYNHKEQAFSPVPQLETVQVLST